MKARAILGFSLTVADLAAAEAFYVDALGFSALGPARTSDPVLAKLLGASGVRILRLQRGKQFLELAAFSPPGAPYPAGGRSNDLLFQHLALTTDDVAVAIRRLDGTRHVAISRHGAQRLPGGIVAYKFRDPEGHPLEFIGFPNPNPLTACGIDHTAISVADIKASTGFYTDALGLTVTSRQENAGPAQDALDGLDATLVDVVGLAPERPGPHLELLGYRNPRGCRAEKLQPADIAASRLVVLVDDLSGQPDTVTLSEGTRAALIRDPDGHSLVLLDRAWPHLPDHGQ